MAYGSVWRHRTSGLIGMWVVQRSQWAIRLCVLVPGSSSYEVGDWMDYGADFALYWEPIL